MPNKCVPFRTWQLEKLANPRLAASYLNAARNDSLEAFLMAVQKVTRADQISRVTGPASRKRKQ